MRFFRKSKDSGFRESRFPVGQWLTAPFRLIFSKLGGSDDGLGQQQSLPKRVVRSVIQVLFFPFWLAFQVLFFIFTGWTATREGGAAIRGALPLLGIGLITAIWVGSGFLEDRLTKRFHREQVIDAELAGNYDVALLCSRRVQNINQEDKWKYIHALTVHRAGKSAHAEEIVKEIAQPDSLGYLPAHLFNAKQLMATPPDDPDYEKALAQARKHLEFVVDNHPNPNHEIYLESLFQLAVVTQAQGRVDEAMEMFANLTSMDPNTSTSTLVIAKIPELAEYLLEKGRTEEADFHIGAGVRALEKKLERNPNQPGLWTMLYDILIVRRDYERIDQLLAQAARQRNQLIRIQIAHLRSRLAVEVAEQFPNTDTLDGFRRKLVLITRALESNSQNAKALREFGDMVTNPPNEEIANWLDGDIRESLLPVITHLIYGIRAAVRGEAKTSRSHLELAFEGRKAVQSIVNGVAASLGLDLERDEQAMKLLDVAIATWPKDARLYRTRGQILMKREQYEQALSELQFAAKELENDHSTYRALADCYEMLGQTGKAEEHRQTAERLLREAQSRIQEQLASMRNSN